MTEPDDRKQPSLAERLGAALRATRKRRGKTLTDIAELIGTTPQTVQRLETGGMPITIDRLEKLCNALNIDPGDLLSSDQRIVGIMAREAVVEEREIALGAAAEEMRLRAIGFIGKLDELLEEKRDISEDDSNGTQPCESQLQTEEDHDSFTTREIQVAEYMRDGETNKSIAMKLGISPRTVEIHRGRMLRKINASTSIVAVLKMIARGYIEPYRDDGL